MNNQEMLYQNKRTYGVISAPEAMNSERDKNLNLYGNSNINYQDMTTQEVVSSILSLSELPVQETKKQKVNDTFPVHNNVQNGARAIVPNMYSPHNSDVDDVTDNASENSSEHQFISRLRKENGVNNVDLTVNANVVNRNNNINNRPVNGNGIVSGSTTARLWTSAEDALLSEAVYLYDGTGKGGGIHWGHVMEHMGGGRSYKQCSSRWDDCLKPRLTGQTKCGPWSEEEDKLLIEAVKTYQGCGKGGGVSWRKVVEHLGGRRSHTQCSKRWSKTVRPRVSGTVASGPWSLEEDALLAEAMGLYEQNGRAGSVNWVQVVNFMNQRRSSQQCHDRWTNILKPRITGEVNTAPWSSKEDADLAEAVRLFDGLGRDGSVSWGRVAKYVGGKRSYKQCNMRWHIILKNAIMQNGSNCNLPGQRNVKKK